MKHILLLIAIVFASLGSAKAGGVDTTVKCIAAVKIKPVKVRYNDSLNAKWLGLKIIDDNLVNRCVLYFALIADGCTVQAEGNIIIDGDLYKQWQGDSEFAFSYTAQKIQVVLTP
mgnify:CR=1 FL=1